MRRWTQRNPVGSLLILVLFLGLSVSSGTTWWAINEWSAAEKSEAKREAWRVLDEKFRQTALGKSETFVSSLRAAASGRAYTFSDDAEVLHFSVYTSDDPKKVYERCDPVLAYLEGKLSRPIVLTIYGTYKTGRAAIVGGEAEFARFGPASYLQARVEDREIVVLAVEEKNWQTTFKGFVVVHKDSGIQNISDLKEKKIAFGDPFSTISSYLFQELLVKEEIHHDDVKLENFESHVAVAEVVIRGAFDAGAIKESTYEKFKMDLRVIKVIDGVPTRPWVARSGLDRKVVDDIRRALLKMGDGEAEALSELGVTRFVEEPDGLYESVEKRIKASEEFWQ